MRYDHKCILVFMSSTRYFCHILIKLEFSRPVLEINIQLSNFKKTYSVGVEFFHADGQTDGRTNMAKLIVAFRNFTNAPKNVNISVLTFAVSVNYGAVLPESLEEGLYTICLVNRTFDTVCWYRKYVKCWSRRGWGEDEIVPWLVLSRAYYSSKRKSVLTIIDFSVFRIRTQEVTVLKR